MISKLLEWWQKAKKPLEIVVIIIACILVITLLVVIALTYIFNVNVPGLHGKTLWDWLQLLIIPAVLAVGGYLFNFTTSRTERNVATDNQREAALKEYIDQISELLLKEHLGEFKPEYETVRNIARVRTLTVLRRLDEVRKGSVLQFLHESKLINGDKSIIDLDGADLSRANLRLLNLGGADLRQANLSHADLSHAMLNKANLAYADLSGANLKRAHLGDANLSSAKLNGADLSKADLRGDTDLTYSELVGANLSDADLKYVNLQGSELTRAIMIETYLRAANLKSVDLSGANLRKAILWDADLSGANLEGVDLRGAELFGNDEIDGAANLSKANLEKANLEGAKVAPYQLMQTKSLKGAIMSNGSKHL